MAILIIIVKLIASSALLYAFYWFVLRNRATYDEARQNPLPKLFRDKRDDRRREAQAQANTNNENNEKPS